MHPALKAIGNGRCHQSRVQQAQKEVVVYGRDNFCGTANLVDRSNTGQVQVHLAQADDLIVPANLLIPRSDGAYDLPLGLQDLDAFRKGQQALDAETIPVVEERLRVEKRRVETAKILVKKMVHERKEALELPLIKEEVEVERVPANCFIEVALEVRQEGEVTIIPVVEEVLVVEKRLLLKEEVRLTKRRKRRSTQRRSCCAARRSRSNGFPRNPRLQHRGSARIRADCRDRGESSLCDFVKREWGENQEMMTMRRIVGLFDDHVQAAKVQQDLIQAGIPGSSICLEDKTTRQREKGFWDSMAEFFGAEDADIYQEAADRGGTLVIADVPDERVDMAVSVMQRHNPIDLQRRTETGKWDRFGLAVQRGYEQTRLRDRTP